MLWAIRALKKEGTEPLWIHIVNSLLPEGITLTYLLKTRPTKKVLDKICPNLPSFYKDIILNWENAIDLVDIDRKEKILKECLWLNKKIQVKGEPLYCNHSIRKGLLYISDIVDKYGKMLDHITLNDKFGTTLTFLDILRIRLTIPHEWKLMLLETTPEQLEPDLIYNKLNNLKNLKTKDLYVLLLKKEHDCTTLTNSHIYWQNRYKLTNDTMKSVYTLPYRVSKLTTLQALQYKIVNKIINCNYWLHKIKILDKPTCRYCEAEETIEHFFFECAVTKQFWYAFLTWWNTEKHDYNPDTLEEKDVILGYNLPDKYERTLNICILIGKKMIYEQKNYHKKQPDIYKYHCDLKEVIRIEKQICIKNDNQNDFYKTWGNLVNM
jgi:hypothetical protein